MVPSARDRDVKGNEFTLAVGALDRLADLGHFRSETVRRASAATLAYLGARRIVAAADGSPNSAEDRRILRLAADMERLADRLDAIPQRGSEAKARRDCWADIVDVSARIGSRLRLERRFLSGSG